MGMSPRGTVALTTNTVQFSGCLGDPCFGMHMSSNLTVAPPGVVLNLTHSLGCVLDAVDVSDTPRQLLLYI